MVDEDDEVDDRDGGTTLTLAAIGSGGEVAWSAGMVSRSMGGVWCSMVQKFDRQLSRHNTDRGVCVLLLLCMGCLWSKARVDRWIVRCKD